jgi:hypothetical protein
MPLVREFCNALRENLPQKDPIFDLKGKVTTQARPPIVYDIVQFGKDRVYREYFVEGPKVPNVVNRVNCGSFPFYQVARVEYVSASRTYSVTLKNGKTYQTATNIPFLYRSPDSARTYTTLVAGVDPKKDSWFWFLSNDPRFKDPREVSLDPSSIAVLEVN